MVRFPVRSQKSTGYSWLLQSIGTKQQSTSSFTRRFEQMFLLRRRARRSGAGRPQFRRDVKPATVLFAIGITLIVAAVPLAIGKVPPNRWYGFRTSTTLADARTWYRVNAATGRSFAACGLMMIAFGLAMVVGAIPSATHWLLLGLLPPVLISAIASGISLDRALRDVEQEQRRAD